MKKLLFALIFGMVLISMVSAQQQSLGIFKVGQDIELIQVCSNCSFNNITYITLPNSTQIVFNTNMSKDGTFYNYTLDSTQTSLLGNYIVNGVGDLNGVNTAWSYDFKITYFGKELSTSQGIMYTSLLGIIIFVMIFMIFAISKLPNQNSRDEQSGELISISWLKYVRSILWFFEWLLIISIFYLTSNLAFAFLEEQLFAQILFTLFRICLALTLPIVVIWFIWIFVKVLQDKRIYSEMKRGFYGGKM